MTESEWLASNDPGPMAHWIIRPWIERSEPLYPGAERRFRLFTCACCRRIWDQLTDERSRKVVEVAEAFADGLATGHQRARAYTAAGRVVEKASGRWPYAAAECAQKIIVHAARALGRQAAPAAASGRYSRRPGQGAKPLTPEAERAHQASILRDIFGNPFGPVALDPRWLTSNVVDLSRTIYEERAFDRLPILADALMDAGCTEEEVLSHCRGPGPHVRGCWVVDLLLGKE